MAIQDTDNSIRDLEDERDRLFKGSPSQDVIRFSELVDEKKRLEHEIDELNKKFIESKIIPSLDLLLLNCIIKSGLENAKEEKTTQEDFDTSAEVIKSTLIDDYTGILFGQDDLYLIKKDVDIDKDKLDKLENLGLRQKEGKETKTESIKVFKEYGDTAKKIRTIFLKDYKKKFDDKNKKLMRVNQEIAQIGDTTKNRELKQKYEKFLEIEKRINDQNKLKRDIEKEKERIEWDISELRDKRDDNEENKEEIDKTREKIDYTQELLEISKKTREKFLSDLLHYVNRKASEFLQNTVKDSYRFNTIEIDSDYKLKIKQKNGEALEDRQINRGNLQISLMSFFFGLSGFLEKKIPYIIDDPLIRLDPGHDKRLIEQLSKTHEQLIFHLIPGKEYTEESFKWLKHNINTQNWIYRENYNNMEEISYTECKNPDKKVDFDIGLF
ncbi:MAG: hypothetical protein ACOC1X_00665 [Promethearchaeota archaeon]